MPSITLKAPTGTTGIVQASKSGTSVTIDANGNASIDVRDIGDLLAVGWTVVNPPGTPPGKYATGALQSAVIPAASLAGGGAVEYENTGVTPANLQLDTAANVLAQIPNVTPGFAWEINIRNSSSGANTATITTNTNWTLHGTMTIAQNVTRAFLAVVNAAGTGIDLWSMGISAAAV